MRLGSIFENPNFRNSVFACLFTFNLSLSSFGFDVFWAFLFFDFA